MKKITEDMELCRFDGVNATAVYVGSMTELQLADLEWRHEDCEYRGDIEVLKLSEIVDQLWEATIITVFINEPMSGTILQYGNYNDGCWWEIGKTDGYW